MKPDWIAIDWGTTNLRAWAMGPQGVMGQACSDDGMSRLGRDQFEAALMALLGPWLHVGRCVPAVACGMVGSRQGWHEAPYRAVPCAPLSPLGLVSVPVQDPRLTLQIAPGLKQMKPADVMRGEETQIAGALALYPNFDGAFCLPGTHSKWVQISAGEVVSFQTYMTGELFDILSNQSVLRLGMSGWDDDSFDIGVAEGISNPQRLSANLFRLRAEGLVADLPSPAARARLSGLLIGAEIAASKPYWLGNRVALIGSDKLNTFYARALAAQGLVAQTLSSKDCTIAGLALAAGALLQRAAE